MSLGLPDQSSGANECLQLRQLHYSISFDAGSQYACAFLIFRDSQFNIDILACQSADELVQSTVTIAQLDLAVG